MASADCEPVTGIWGQSPSGVQGDKVLVRGSGAKAPEAGGILISDAKNKTETEKIKSNKS